MNPLRPEEFDDFFAEVHGYEPFPWQRRLARQVLEDGRWPDLLALPTGSGKTSAIDVAVFALAAEALSGRAEIRHPRRIVYVVDRRLVVDQAETHAQKLASQLASARAGASGRVAEGLRRLVRMDPPAAPLGVALLRGGMPRESEWARRPDLPQVIASTVDQVGSRFLFRGYGVSRSMAPVHAGLLGNDALYLLDEVHLSVPWAETLLAVRERWRLQGGELPDRFGVVRMSATPGAGLVSGTTFDLSEEDHRHPVLSRRLASAKPVRLAEVAVRGDEESRRKQFAAACVKEARRHFEEGARTVAVVVNRVDSARRIAALARADGDNVEVRLLTGRIRPLDRARILDALLPKIQTGRRRDAESTPLLLVSTQCIEAGADLDLDALVTECASIDALRQRFGRVDRAGELGRAPGTIVVRSDQVAKSPDPDPIYGEALAATWRRLAGIGEGLDFGLTSENMPEPAADLLVKPQSAPVMLPAHLDAWCQTSEELGTEPDVSLWLHGPARSVPEVQVVWRADLTEELLERAKTEKPAQEEVLQRIVVCPPSSLEAMPVPIHEVRDWLARRASEPVGDVEGGSPPDGRDEPAEAARPFVVWRGEQSTDFISDVVRPGDTIVVPATYGGVGPEDACWDPGSTEPVADLAELANFRMRGRAVLRVFPRPGIGVLGPESTPAPPARPGAGGVDGEFEEDLAKWIAAARADAGSPLSPLVRQFPDSGRNLLRRIRIVPLGDDDYAVVLRRRVRGEALGDEHSTEDENSSFTSIEVGLTDHCGHVKAWADAFAESLGLPERIRTALREAAWLHDLGKLDPRFQLMLVGGNRARAALLERPLAKSAQPPGDLLLMQEVRRRSGYPAGARHELLSVAMLEAAGTPSEAPEMRDLVLHLVGSHHGWCRPFAPPWEDPEDLRFEGRHGEVEWAANTRHGLGHIGSGVAERFWTLNERFGWWGLAWLEAVLRLADHRASEAEQEAQDGD